VDLEWVVQGQAPSVEAAGAEAAASSVAAKTPSSGETAPGMLRRRSDEELLTGVRAAAAREREATEVVLRYLLEVERRKLYLRRGFSSLFDFCVQELGYCAGSAHMRIQSMRLLRDLSESKRAEVTSKIASGRLTISQLSNLQTYSRQVGPRGVEPERKLEILARVEGESTRASQKIILQELGVEVAALERMRIRGPDQVELTVTLSGEAVELLEEWKALTSHSHPEGRNGEAILAALRVAVEQGRKRKWGAVGRSVNGEGGSTPGSRETSAEGSRVGSGAHGMSVPAFGGTGIRGMSPPAFGAAGVPSMSLPGTGATEAPGTEGERVCTSPGEIPSGPPSGSRGRVVTEFALTADESLHAHEVLSTDQPVAGQNSAESFAGPENRRQALPCPVPPVAPPFVSRPASSPIPASIRRLVWHRDGAQCTFVDHRSGRRCLGRRYLEIDHVRARAEGGGHQLANLRLLCGAHHRMRHRAGGAL
jgi:hypothetical protein